MMAATAPSSDQAERFVLTLSLCAAVDELRDWLRAAAAGDEAVYATGAWLPRAADAAVLARRWEAAGWVVLDARRHADGRRHEFTMARTSSPIPSQTARAPASSSRQAIGREESPHTREPAVHGSAPLRAVDRTLMNKLLAELRRCAEDGAACPSYLTLAIRIGLLGSLRSTAEGRTSGAVGRTGRPATPGERRRAIDQVAYLHKRLEREGGIAVESRGRNAPRVVTILAAGRACGSSTASSSEAVGRNKNNPGGK